MIEKNTEKSPAANRREYADAITLLTLNLRFGLADDGSNSWRFRRRAFRPLLQQYPADFYAFQEANSFQVRFLAQILTAHDYIGRRIPAPRFWQNNVIFFERHWRCRHCEHFFLSDTPDIPSRFRLSRWPRQCTLGVFEKNDRALALVNTHLDFESSVQEASARIILDRLKQMAPAMPVILTGDFNSRPDGSCYKVFTGGGNLLSERRHQFRNAFRAPFPGTHHGFSGRAGEDHIDWILYSGDMSVRESAAITSRFANYYPSDHFPLRAVMEWAGTPAPGGGKHRL